MRICCIGAGYVGGPTMTMIARKCPDIRVDVVDINAERIAAWNSDSLPVFEPGLEEIVRLCRGRNLFFSTDVDAAVDAADIVFISVNTPTKTYGYGAGSASDLRFVESCARKIAEVSRSGKIVVEKSTLPVRTADVIRQILSSTGMEFQVLSNPEFLAEGTAIRDLESPDRVLIGGDEGTEAGRSAIDELAGIYARWVPEDRIIKTNLCADVEQVARAVGSDTRIGSKFLNSSVGYGGSCFQKDLLNLIYLCEHFNLPEVARYWRGVVEINAYQKRRFAEGVIDSLYRNICGKRLAIFGFAFKEDTNDTRESPAIDICRLFLNERAQLAVFDPKVSKKQILADLNVEEGDPRVEFCASPYEAAEKAHAIVLLTQWKEFKNLDYKKIKSAMATPAWIFDGRNCLDHRLLGELGFLLRGIGKGNLS